MVDKQGDSVAVREESAQARSEPGGVDEVHEVAFAGMLVAKLRGFLGSRRRVASITDLEPLIDILVHDQDIARPLGVDHPIPPDAAAAAADRVLGTPAPIRRWKPTTSLTPNRESWPLPGPSNRVHRACVLSPRMPVKRWSAEARLSMPTWQASRQPSPTTNSGEVRSQLKPSPISKGGPRRQPPVRLTSTRE